MCYPTIDGVKNLPINEEGCRKLIWQALRNDFPNAVSFLGKLSRELLGSDRQKIIKTEDPESETGKELKEIMGSDVNRSVLGEYACHGLTLGFLHCCGIAMARNPDELKITASEHLQVYREQVERFGVCKT